MNNLYHVRSKSKIRKPNNKEILWASKRKGLRPGARIRHGFLCLKEIENLRFDGEGGSTNPC